LDGVTLSMSSDEAAAKLTATIAGTETLRLAEMHTVDVFYTPLEERFERITRTAKRLFGVPVAAVTVVNEEKQWFKSVAGWAISELPVEQSLCASTISDNRLTVVPDTTADPRYAEHPLVVGKPHFRFYAGYPLRDRWGKTTATLCLLDVKPRKFSADDTHALRDLGQMAQGEIFSERLSEAQSKLISKLGLARREAMFDALTRVWNRRGATSLLGMALKEAEEAKTEVSICLLDIDNFKRINDNYGHQAGDQVLRKIAGKLVSCLRDEDLVCRYGGDEFLLILRGMGVNEIRGTGERVRRTVAESPFATRDGAIPVTISVGCATRGPNDGRTPDELTKLADDALIQCKSDGRNRVKLAG